MHLALIHDPLCFVWVKYIDLLSLGFIHAPPYVSYGLNIWTWYPSACPHVHGLWHGQSTTHYNSTWVRGFRTAPTIAI